MNLTYLFGLLVGLLVLAFAANRLFRWTRIPDVVTLMSTGVVIGLVVNFNWIFATLHVKSLLQRLSIA